MSGIDVEHEIANCNECDKEWQGRGARRAAYAHSQEAVRLAIDAGQISSPQWPPKLYSEDLW